MPGPSSSSSAFSSSNTGPILRNVSSRSRAGGGDDVRGTAPKRSMLRRSATSSSVFLRSARAAGATSLSAAFVVERCWFRVTETSASASSAASMSSLDSFRACAVRAIRPSTSRALSSRPPSTRLASRTMVWSWPSPPPLMTSDAEVIVSSIVGAALVRSARACAPSRSCAPESTSSICTNSSPSGVVARSRAVAPSWRTAPTSRMSRFTRAVKFCATTSRTRPTVTPWTFTGAPWARLRASSNTAPTR